MNVETPRRKERRRDVEGERIKEMPACRSLTRKERGFRRMRCLARYFMRRLVMRFMTHRTTPLRHLAQPNVCQTRAMSGRFLKTRLKLFAGIEIGSSHTNPTDAPNATTASMSRTPHAGSRLRNC